MIPNLRIPLKAIRLIDAERKEVAAKFTSASAVGTFNQGETTLICPTCESDLIRGLGQKVNRLFAGIGLRCHCGAWSMIEDGTQWSATRTTPEAAPIISLYRYFDTENHRDAFLDGQVWTTTMWYCRQHADESRADTGEGTLSYSHDPISGRASDPRIREVARRLHLGIGDPEMEIQLAGNEVGMEVPDAWMLCVSRVYSPLLLAKFGQFCVRIERPASLFVAISEAIEKEMSLWLGGYRRVYYQTREARNLDPIPASPAFVKPVEYEREFEMRFAWLP
ncbi:hypothetical protein, partial [Gemmatimonas sp.]|uniref:hypothetical protein n=1 Tax=Gemmatimonas sp. TaxID=1962908 RepID=UPI0035664155